MNTWQKDLLDLLLITPANGVQVIFSRIEHAARSLGFEHVAYGFQAPYPITHPKITLLNNYPTAWQHHYAQAEYLHTDPTVIHGRASQAPLLWSEQNFATNPTLWADAQDHGLRVGWAQSCLDTGSGGMLTLCRSRGPLTSTELSANETAMRWLVQVAHVACAKLLVRQNADTLQALTAREREVLQWTADGKSAQDIADILKLSKSAVDFHITNAIRKLQTANKTAAVARAVLLGLLY